MRLRKFQQGLIRAVPDASRPPGEAVESVLNVYFSLIDRITDIQEGRSLTAVKALTLSEDYLQDHFPRFPVMPGVLMLEAMYQAGAWLIHRTNDFSHSIVELREARNIKYADFVEPGQVLTLTAQLVSQDGAVTKLKTQGVVGDAVAVSGRLILGSRNLADDRPNLANLDQRTLRELQRRFANLYYPSTALQSIC